MRVEKWLCALWAAGWLNTPSAWGDTGEGRDLDWSTGSGVETPILGGSPNPPGVHDPDMHAKILEAPKSVTAKQQGRQIQVAWKGNRGENDGFNIYIRKDGGLYFKANTKILYKNMFTSYLLEGKKTYWVVVKATDENNRESAGSRPIKVKVK